MLGKDVLENQQYQDWMNTFPSNVQVSFSVQASTIIQSTSET
jgi:hypothetical protein